MIVDAHVVTARPSSRRLTVPVVGLVVLAVLVAFGVPSGLATRLADLAAISVTGRSTVVALGRTGDICSNDGLLASRTDAAGTTSYTYDSSSRLSTMTGAGTTATVSYNSLNQPTQVAYSGGTTKRSLAYDTQHRLATDTVAHGSTTLGRIAYGYDNNGNTTEKDTSGFTGAANNTYTYDWADRLTSWTDGTTATSYGYDDAGNRTQLGAATLTYDARDELLTDSVTGSYAYTARGTLASQVTPSQQTLSTTDDALGQVITQDATNGSQAAYSYDGLGRLVAPGLAYTGLANTVAADGVATYNRDPGGGLYATTQGGVSRLDWTDQHDDVVGQYSASASALTGSATYNPLGITLAGSGLVGSLGYQSELSDTATGRVNMMARWYDPATGQFDNPDTLAQSSVPHSVDANRHAYVADNPLRYTDPTGHVLKEADTGGTAQQPDVRVTELDDGACADLPPQRVARCEADVTYQLTQATNVADARDAADTRLICKTVDGTRQCLTRGEWNADSGQPRVVNMGDGRVVVLNPDGTGTSYQVVPPMPPAPPQKPECHGFWGCVANFVVDHAGDIAGIAAGFVAGAACTALTLGIGALGCAVIGGVIGGAVGSLVTGLQQGKTGWNLVSDIAVGAVIGGVSGLIGGAVGKAVLGTIGKTLLKTLVPKGAGLLTRVVGNTITGAVTGAINGAAIGAGAGAIGAAINYATTCGSSCSPLAGLEAAGQGALSGAINGAETGAAFGAAFGALAGIKAPNKKAPSLCRLQKDSFTPDTPVLMADGSTKPIADIQLGDQVKATDPDTNQTHPEPVTHLYLNHDHQFTDITIKQTQDAGASTTTTPAQSGALQRALLSLSAAVALATGLTAVIHTTQEHPFWDTTTHTWVNAADLTIGDTLQTDTGQTIHILAVTNTTSTRDMYNLTIDQIHTYYVLAGKIPVLVHNANCPTTGILEIGDERIPLVSGSPRLPNYQASGHVEGQAALIMRERGITSAVLHIDNPNGICLYCTRQVPTLLPEGAVLDVRTPLGTVTPSRWWSPSRIFVGNSRIPLPWPRSK